MIYTPLYLQAIKSAPFQKRFFDRVAQSADGCHVWTGSTNTNGYGQIGVRGYGSIGVHCAAWIMASGIPIPDGLQVDHLCRNRRCVNPEHLEVVTASVNAQRQRSAPTSIQPTHPPTLRVREYRTRTAYQVLWRQIVDGKLRQCGRTFPTEQDAASFMAQMTD